MRLLHSIVCPRLNAPVRSTGTIAHRTGRFYGNHASAQAMKRIFWSRPSWLLVSGFVRSLLIVVYPVLVLSPQAQARSTASELATVAFYERILFGVEKNQLAVEKRLGAIEESLFGSRREGSTGQRLDRIAPLLEDRKALLLMPPLAPSLDPAGVRHRSSRATGSRSTAVADLLREAMSLDARGDAGGAERLLRQVAAMEPDNADALFSLGAIHERRGEPARAEEYYQRALKSSPGDIEITEALAAVGSKLNYDGMAFSRESPDRQKWHSRVLADRAAEAYGQGRWDEAISYTAGNSFGTGRNGKPGEITAFTPDVIPSASGGMSSDSSIFGRDSGITTGRHPSRMKTAFVGSLAGAALGAMLARGTETGAGKGALQGALYGGVAGFFLGGR